MKSVDEEGGPTTFMAECFWPGVSEPKVAEVGARLRQASLAASSTNGLPRYLASILVPTDEIALVLLEASSIDAATELAGQAAIPSERILEIKWLGAFLPGLPRQRHISAKELR
jgi:hypothetical protein